MRLSVGCNWDDNLIENMSKYPVVNLYGKANIDAVGGGRPTYLLPEVNEKRMKDYIFKVQKSGMKFTYLLNSFCLGNKEFIAKSHNQIIETIDQVASFGVDSITVSIPYLLQIIKYRYPHIKVGVSVYAYINSVRRAQMFESLGADTIALPEFVNRDFQLLESIRNSVKCDIQLMANNSCLFGCPFQLYHGAITSHASQLDDETNGFYIDYCILNCMKRKVTNQDELIKSRWIRPEDLHVYEDIGIDHFKLVERFNTTEVLTTITRAYSERRYEGNLIDILDVKTDPKRQLPIQVSYFNRPEYANIKNMMDFEDALFVKGQYLDNRALDGFLDYFKKMDCNRVSCVNCGYCSKIAQRAYKADQNNLNYTLAKIDTKLDDLVTSKFFDMNRDAGEISQWSTDAKTIFSTAVSFIDSNVRDIASKVVQRQAEENAKKREHEKVLLDDLIHAFISETPKHEYEKMATGLKELGINIDVYKK